MCDTVLMPCLLLLAAGGLVAAPRHLHTHTVQMGAGRLGGGQANRQKMCGVSATDPARAWREARPPENFRDFNDAVLPFFNVDCIIELMRFLLVACRHSCHAPMPFVP
jgi:hypothetical protein